MRGGVIACILNLVKMWLNTSQIAAVSESRVNHVTEAPWNVTDIQTMEE
jgi:hypothetical protein